MSERVKKKRKAFKTSPSVRIPRAAVEKLQESKVQAQAIQLMAMGNCMEKAIDAYARRHRMLFDGLREMMGFFDKVNGGKDSGQWTVAEVKRIEEIRLLSIGV